jgi:hypothetical protein
MPSCVVAYRQTHVGNGGPQLSLDSLVNGWADFGPPKLLASFYGPLKPGADSLADHAALELGKSDFLSGCGRGRYRDPATHRCRGPADIG